MPQISNSATQAHRTDVYVQPRASNSPAPFVFVRTMSEVPESNYYYVLAGGFSSIFELDDARSPVTLRYRICG